MSITPKPNGNVISYYSGDTETSYDAIGDRKWVSLSIINDGATDLIFRVNNITITVMTNESFDDNFEDFASIAITTNVAYRLVLRG